ncbi:hypothetical protein M2459_003504 [Parabacteroides sp. PF5-5]|uniref:PKD domain-containing protein n=1 Tax=unclassified Parabacteroides TaxID=2649774 RepID=UPI002475B0DA|nr:MULTISPECIES: PKD domain-containing protein [unclassified Parabacteroides]MDH6306869.1 hypothetical protein [Parabacteroides sp. PH5-39]MDH6317743.1 hypothetical protein [Parabacteroides sp. PF5-13]MDH6321615.1 hypothetical protein [Parabacteroides sp. PH5-13]MDH6325256.1 hypothetical protein [Parabacteroides sp. PH5-8]MDH6328928.1 hypothetical protein [Parabacteroides sp. PH5-41]
MKRIIYITCLLLTVIFASHAQKETHNWYWGIGAGLTWNSTRSFNATAAIPGVADSTLVGLPALLSGGQMNQLEGCFSLSDSEGNLLMYSDGVTLWNKNHGIMADDLKGHLSSPQSGIIFPYPGHPNQYVVASIGAQPNVDQLIPIVAYSIVDMNLNSGLGSVVEKNIQLLNGDPGVNVHGMKMSLSESITAIPHANKQDYWVIVPGSGKMNAWLVTADSVHKSTPIISTIGPSLTYNGAKGYIKMTPDGKHFAWGTWVSGNSLLFGDFDNNTGIFSNKHLYNSANFAPYGVEFSPSGKYLYVMNIEMGSKKLHVIDMEATLAIPESYGQFMYPPQKVYDLDLHGGLQLGADGRIYCSYLASPGGDESARTRDLHVIDNPEEFDNLRIYKLENFLSEGMQSGMGLPSFCASWFSVSIQGPKSFCANTSQTFELTVKGNYGLSYTTWDFGDGSTLITDNTNTTGTQTQPHTYATAGTYTITVKSFQANDTEVADKRQTLEVTVLSAPTILSVATSGACETPTLTASSKDNKATFKWYSTSTGTTAVHTGSTYSPTFSGSASYWVEAVNEAGCESSRVKVDVGNCGSLTTSLTGSTDLIINKEGSYTVTIDDTTGEVNSSKWDFGDGSALVDGTSSSHSKNHTYPKRGNYVVTVSFYDAEGNKIGEETLRVKVGSGMLPVNHNISVMGY